MGYVSNSISRVGGQRVILGLGWLYVAVAAGLPLLYVLEIRGLADVLTISLLVGTSGLVHVYFGNLLPNLDVRPDLYDEIARWCLRAIAIILAVILFVAVVASVNDPLTSVLILSALASVAGLGMGYRDAQAKTRAFDAEDRQREAERYSQELERYETIVETVNDGIFVADQASRFLLVNEAYTDLVGYTREELIGAHASLVVDENVTMLDERVKEDIRAGAANTYETTLTTASGETVAVEWTGALLPPSADGRRDLVGVVRDVTRRNRRKRQLEAQNAQLENFAGMLTHELRNPVSIGQIYSQQLPETANPEAHEYVTEAFDRIEDLIDVMLVLTQGGEAMTERAPVDLAAAARDAWAEVDAPDVALELEIDRTVIVDDTYIRHLFRNLFENAVEHGGADRITVGDFDDGFYVADDGAGIPGADRDTIFESGYTTAGDDGGMGLGLTFVQEMAQIYEWRCSVTESDEGGASFEFEGVEGVQDATRDVESQS
ncbi:PAS domain S-box protein [Natrononativus amylolyticus]|uniref:PAS domain S-box protein n=1 Tax=Natrononativus amylolyticus TaxID=2963434 RepID=UPI0020CE1694|nr:PAS domain-containing sensor histidine kinase [Natrononativus amylolyticus]